MARRTSHIELSFDSMTDLITNLSGGLILIVLLVAGLTREATAPSQGKSPTPVCEQINQLRFDVQTIDQRMSGTEQRLDAWEQDIQELCDQAAASRALPDT
jgi:hypothetical protein